MNDSRPTASIGPLGIGIRCAIILCASWPTNIDAQRSLGAEAAAKTGIARSGASSELGRITVRLSIPKHCRASDALCSIEMRNESGASVYSFEAASLPNDNMTIELRDSDAKAVVEMSKSGKRSFRQTKIGGSGALTRVETGTSHSWTLDLAKFYSLRRGNFRFSATFRFTKVQPGAAKGEAVEVVVQALDFSVSE